MPGNGDINVICNKTTYCLKHLANLNNKWNKDEFAYLDQINCIGIYFSVEFEMWYLLIIYNKCED